MSCFALHLFWFSVCFSLLHLHVSCFSVLCYLLSYCLLFFSGCFWLLFCFVFEAIVSSYVILLVLLSVSADLIQKRLLGFSGLVVFCFSCGVIVFSEVKGWCFFFESENCMIQYECNGLRLIAQALGR